MLLDTCDNTITGNIPTQSATHFTTELNSIAFDILSKGIYKDPIKALVRELCANAHDAHICANNQETPFYIQAPDYIEPTFRIRDYGTGINPEQIGQIYFSYFSSNKRHTNTLIGGKGLGSKTPLAYTDSYAVTNYYHGKAYHYTIYKDQTGCPTFNLITYYNTQEPNGLEIIIAVRQEDTWAFQTKIKQTARWFHCKSNIDIPELKWLIKTKTGGILKDKEQHPDLSIIMGNIPYTYTAYKVTQGERNWLHRTEFQLFANIGDYPVTASRDNVVESDEITTQLSDLTDRFLQELKDLIRQQIDGLKEHKALIQLQQILLEYGITNAAGNQITYKNDKDQYTVLTVISSINITVPNELKGKIWEYQWTKTRRHTVKIEKHPVNTILCYNIHQTPTFAHSDYPYRNNPQFLENTPSESKTYILHSDNPQDIETFYGLFPNNIEHTDVSKLFAPIPRQRSNKPRAPRVQQPLSYSILTETGIEKTDTLDLSKPIWLINRLGTNFVIQNTTIDLKPIAIGQCLQHLIPGTYVVIQKSTANKAIPPFPYIDETLTNLLNEKYTQFTDYLKDYVLLPYRELYETVIKKLHNKQAFEYIGYKNLASIPEFHDLYWMASFYTLSAHLHQRSIPSTVSLHTLQPLETTLKTRFPIFGLIHGKGLNRLTPIEIDILNQYL